MKRKFLCAIMSLCLTAAFTGCGTTSTEPTESAAQTSQASSGEQSQAEHSHYPVEITTYSFNGDEATTVYDKAPEKVVAVYQGCIETMIALGLQDRVIASYGLDNQIKDEWKDGFAKMNYDDSTFFPVKESMVLLNPDMIFGWGSLLDEKRLGDVDYWLQSGTNFYINTNTRRGGTRLLEHEFQDIIKIGQIFDVEDKALAIVNEMKAEVDQALQISKDKQPQTVAIIEFLDTLTNYGADSLGGDMVKQLGGQMAIPDAKTIGTEHLLESDPDVIFVVYMANRGDTPGEDVRQTQLDHVLNDPTLASLQAVQNGRVYPIMLGDMYASAVRSIDGIRSFAAGLYPELAER